MTPTTSPMLPLPATRTYRTYCLVIDGISPTTVPMSRLAQYVADLAGLLGNRKHVRFGGLEAGSLVLNAEVDGIATRAVDARLLQARQAEPPADVAKHLQKLNRRLAEDGATGLLQDRAGTLTVHFEGRTSAAKAPLGPFREKCRLRGQIILVGGSGQRETVPVHLREGTRMHHCRAPRTLARDLAPQIFGPPLHVHGTATLVRDSEGTWKRRSFDIESFETDGDARLAERLRALAAIPGRSWTQVEDPIAELQRLRHGPEDEATRVALPDRRE